MIGRTHGWSVDVVAAVLLGLAGGCQVYNTGREIRSGEQMLYVSFENERAQELFIKAVKTTYGDEMNVRRVGVPSFSLYSWGETLSWNANCNEHIKKMDTDGDLYITEQEAQAHYNAITAATRE